MFSPDTQATNPVIEFLNPTLGNPYFNYRQNLRSGCKREAMVFGSSRRWLNHPEDLVVPGSRS